jgi:hypothetical protein
MGAARRRDSFRTRPQHRASDDAGTRLRTRSYFTKKISSHTIGMSLADADRALTVLDRDQLMWSYRLACFLVLSGLQAF